MPPIGEAGKKELIHYLKYAFLFACVYGLIYFSSILLFKNALTACSASTDIYYFLTSPISYCENFAAPSLLQGLEGNYFWLIAFFALCAYYSAFIQTYSKKLITLNVTVFASIFSTYIFSAYVWYIDGIPGTGTSIIAFGLSIFLLIACCTDLYIWIKSNKEKRLKMILQSEFLKINYDYFIKKYKFNKIDFKIPKFLTRFAAKRSRPENREPMQQLKVKYAYRESVETILVCSAIFLFLAIFNLYGLVSKINRSSPSHLIGGFFFLLLVFMYFAIRPYLSRKIFVQTLSPLSVMIFFTILVIIGAYLGYELAYTYSTTVVIAKIDVFSYNSLSTNGFLLTNTTEIGYFNLGANYSYPAPCPSNATILNNISVQQSNFKILEVWPILPLNIEKGCRGDAIVVKIGMPDYPYVGNITLVENVT